MDIYNANIEVHRGGAKFRHHAERYFYLKKTGWFLHTRGEVVLGEGLELTDGIAGPFRSRAAAKFFLLKLIYEEHPELFYKNDEALLSSSGT
ncbi:hypothetical protein MNBD_GAMMA21-257 [hydrothermal vent metagenome]|uniref:Uncharacterized protein n=1 Tax=hydrothermal vent metagenome TaxID=652676 RepID=A0A3B1B6H5_9ZZZZ